MHFHSIDFAIFLPAVFLLYWLLVARSLKLQNLFIVASSYVFYGWWDWRFLALIVFSSAVDYFVGLGMAKAETGRKRKVFLATSIACNIGLLAFFKYFNFFLENFATAFTFLGRPIADPSLLNIVLPVGISFYTFQTLSYTIDVYRRKMEPTGDIVAFFAFVSFFPQLVAGPIERAANFLPQFYKRRKFDHDQAVDGMRQILWGLFKKIVIADNCAMFANEIFGNYATYGGSTLLLGSFFFAFQIYGDFSGYSDIAIGTGRLFGFSLMKNFAFPYFSRDIAEFWRRWHISLSTWFRDYVYIPLGGSRGGGWLRVRNVFIIFIASGFWHGANWTFVAWGAINAVFLLPLMLLGRNRVHTDVAAEGKFCPTIREVCQIAVTFLLTLLAWVLFRSDSLQDALLYISGIFRASLFSRPEVGSLTLVGLIVIFTMIEWFQREKEHALEFGAFAVPTLVRWVVYLAIVVVINLFAGKEQDFIYFQF